MKKIGLLLINLGTPSAPDFWSVWRYLREFLNDKRVITLPAVLRFFILYGLILPGRVAKTTKAYQKIWSEKGSPLRVHSEDLCQRLQVQLGDQYQVVLAMRYGQPSIAQALAQMQNWEHLYILPLYPQYSSAATGSSLEAVLRYIGSQSCIPNLTVIREFYQHPSFIQAQAQQIRSYISDHDAIVFSYHGLPVHHLQQAGCQAVCDTKCTIPSKLLQHPNCYRAQCYQTSALLAEALQLEPHQYMTVFQSRLGRTPWIQPYMEEYLAKLPAQGVKRIAIACPSFVADCLETLEEIGDRMAAAWRLAGGEQLTLIPCLNAESIWCEAIQTICVSQS